MRILPFVNCLGHVIAARMLQTFNMIMEREGKRGVLISGIKVCLQTLLYFPIKQKVEGKDIYKRGEKSKKKQKNRSPTLS